jgi:5-(carboxyamino)imidazole ribonucleotide synthase
MRIGVLGGGQLGRMLALAGYNYGFRFVCFEPSPEAQMGHVAPHRIATFNDHAALEAFAQEVDLVTYEFENVPADAVRHLEPLRPVHPNSRALATTQDRILEKACFGRLGIETNAHHAVATLADLQAAVAALGTPCVLKTRRFGYDGKGQAVIRDSAPVAVAAAWKAVGEQPSICEAFVAFDREVSIVAARSTTGEIVTYPLVENHHRGGILRKTIAPAPNLTPALQALAEGYVRRVLEDLDYVGVLAIEFFQVGDHLLGNEMAPRVHNSGHWTMDGATTSQFANHLRALAGWKLGDTQPTGHAVMLNIIGTSPAPEALASVPGARIHLYAKSARPGRKLGHVNVVGASPAAIAASVSELERLIAAAESNGP